MMKRKTILIYVILVLLAFGNAACTVGDTDQHETVSKIHFLVLPDTQPSNAILIESDGHYGLIDASNPSNSSHSEFNYQNGNGETVAEYLRLIDVKHLDFILATHSHSDHIGGIPDIAKSKNKDDGYFVDENTAYIYKEYVASKKDSVKAYDEEHLREEYESEAGWYNDEYAQNALTAMQDRNALLLNTGDPSNKEWQDWGAEYQENTNNKAGCTLTFQFGDGEIKLFNLFHISDHSENANSIVTLFACDSKYALITGDLDLYDNAEDYVMDAVSSDIHGDRIDILQAGHHGFYRSTSIDT